MTMWCLRSALISNYLNRIANLEKFSFNFKSLLDAIRVRNHVIEMFEKADRGDQLPFANLF